MEIWKDIEGYEGYYQVSDLGRVRSCERVVMSGGHKRRRKSQYRKTSFKAGEYARLLLSKEGCNKMHYLHRIMATAFLPNPKNKKTVNHINGIKSDNTLSNLEWATYSENNLHAFKTELKESPRGKKQPWHQGENHHQAKIKEDDARLIKHLSLCGINNVLIARELKISKSIVSKVCNGKTWKHLNL